MDEIIQWIMFLQVSLVATGAGFGLGEAEIRDRISTYVIGGLRGLTATRRVLGELGA